MTLFLELVAFWTALFQGFVFTRKRWLLWRLSQPVRYVSEIRKAGYYAQLPEKQFERLIMKSLKEHGYVILGDPYLGRSKSQGYAWKKGKKYIIVQHTGSPLQCEKLEAIRKAAKLARADHALIFCPSMKALTPPSREIQILAGKQLIAWFAVLNDLRPPMPQCVPAERCSCGSACQPRINLEGNLLIICSRFPLCRKTRLLETAWGQLPARIHPALA